jgi:hypothetical protein
MFALMVALCSGKILRAADSIQPGFPPSKEAAVTMEYQKTDNGAYGPSSWNVSVTTQSAPFKKEPAAGSGKIVRGVLNFGANSSNAIPFLWQQDAWKLYLDLNRNRDLTDDPAGVLLSDKRSGVHYQMFTNVHLVFDTPSGQRTVLADINFYDFFSQASCMFTVRTFWQGKLTLRGQDWQAGIIPSGADHVESVEGSRLLLRPWENRKQRFNVNDGSLATIPFARNLFIDGHAYQLDWTSPRNGGVAPVLRFVEQSFAPGQLDVTGKFIRRLVLTGLSNTVILNQPSGVMKVPTGNYDQSDVRVGKNDVETSSKYSGRIFVGGAAPAVLKIGGPLTNSVAVTRHGRDLQFDYRLVGAGGETYQAVNENRSHPPEFAVYKDGKKIASGAFEFG